MVLGVKPIQKNVFINPTMLFGMESTNSCILTSEGSDLRRIAPAVIKIEVDVTSAHVFLDIIASATGTC